MPRAKRSDYRRGTLDLLVVEDLFRPEDFDSVVEIIGSESVDEDRVRTVVLRLNAGLNFALHERGRPNAAQKRAALKAIAQQSYILSELLRSLDDESKRDLGWAAAEDKEPEHDDIERSTWRHEDWYSLIGPHRINMVSHKLGKLHSWASDAATTLPADPPGRMRYDAERQAIIQLLQLWNEAHPPLIMLGGQRKERRPSRTQLANLARAALGPVLKAYRSDVRLDAICAEVLRNLP